MIAFQLATATTAAQNIWYELALLWEDRQNEVRNGYRYGPFGGAGADLRPVTKGPVVAPVVPVASVWMKGLGSWTKRNATGAINIPNNDPTFDLGYKQDTYGFIGGVDIGRESLFTGYDALIFGAMGGYLSSNVNFNTRGTQFKYDGGTVGATVTWLNWGFFADALLKADFLKLKINSADLAFAGVTNLPDTDVRTWGILANVGYRWDFGGGYGRGIVTKDGVGGLVGGWGGLFIEPIATLAYARTHIDSLDTLSTLGANLSWNDASQSRLALGARFGVSNANWWVGRRVELSLTTRWWDVFRLQQQRRLARRYRADVRRHLQEVVRRDQGRNRRPRLHSRMVRLLQRRGEVERGAAHRVDQRRRELQVVSR